MLSGNVCSSKKIRLYMKNSYDIIRVLMIRYMIFIMKEVNK